MTTWIDKFWSRVEKSDGCWLWTGARSGGKKEPYGTLCFGSRKEVREGKIPRRTEYAHRLSYLYHHGPISPGLQVMHSCDNTLCVNPKHLSLGTPAQNARDMVRKGRDPKPSARLFTGQVVEIRRRLAEKENHENIAADFGVGRGCITAINLRKTWRDL